MPLMKLISGKRTLGENVADNGGARMAYKAYVSSNMFKLDKVLPGFKYDLKQMFWIALAQAHCAKYTPEALKTRLFDDDHTIPRYRVIGIVQNQQEFADDFGCKISPMNPEKKCVVW
ncbi:ECE2 (predicted) [Pycnogonum litorale]